MKLNERIGFLVLRAGISKAELGRRCGVTQAAVVQWITGSKTPRLRMTQKIARAFDVTLADLFQGVEL